MGYEPIKEETKELYLKIWMNYCISHLNQEQLAKLFTCSQDTIANGIAWAAENRTRFQTAVLAEAAKESLENRLREQRSDLVKIKESPPINWNAVIGMNKLIKDNEELLWKLQAVIQDRSVITLNTVQVNNFEKARQEILEDMTADEQREIIAYLRKIGKQQGDKPESAS